ncbi:MAG: type II secretion system secretin GspD [Pseudomonadota bacterium]
MSKALSVLIGLAAMVGAAFAQDAENCGPELNYEDADIRSVVDEIAVRTGRTFLLDPAVQGRVTIKSPPNGGVCADEAWALFLATLRVNDFTATPIGEDEYKIVPVQDAARSGGRVSSGAVSGDEYVTEIVRLRYVDAREAAANLAQIIGDNGVVSPVRRANSVIIVDVASNVARLRQVLAELDKDTTVYRTIALNHASAADVARVVSDLAREINEESGAGGEFSVVPVEASNSVLIRADPALLRRLQTVIAELDRFGQNASELAVVYLNHASAEDLAPILTEVANNGPTTRSEGQAVDGLRAKITFHEATNAIIINGDADIQRTLQNVIAKLDVRRPQVLVEAIIVEISDNLARDLGVQYFLTGDKIPFSATNFSSSPNIFPAAGAALLNGDRFNGLFGTTTTETDDDGNTTTTTENNIQADLATAALNSLLGIQGIGIGGGFEFGNGNIFGAVLTAVQSDSDSNVLSTPSIMTLDNQTARLQVGQEIPITTGEAVGDNFQNAFRTVNREQVGVILEVTPQINEGDSVTLEITQETSSVAGPITANSTDLITNKREITTTALVDDGDILVIGGLIDDSRFVNEEKVPLLGDLPALGGLFRQRSRENRRQNLMVFIRPTIVRDPETARAATRKKLDFMRAREILSRGDPQSDIDRMIDQVTGVTITGPTAAPSGDQ